MIGHRFKRNDTKQRLLMSKFFLLFHRILFFSNIKDPSCPYIFCKTSFFKKINPYLKFMIEGFWWGFIAICLKKNININQIRINHKQRISGDTNVFHLKKIPSIAVKNIIGLIKIRIIKIREKKFFFFIKGSVCFEIFVKYPSEKDFFWKIGKKTKSVPEKFYKSFKKIKFQGYEYSIPKLTDDYLKYRYGNWKKQVKTWNPEKDDLAIK